MTSGSVTLLSRADWENTFPRAPHARRLDEEVASTSFSFDPRANGPLGNGDGSLVAPNGGSAARTDGELQVYDMRGLDYNDPAWGAFLDRIDYSSREVRQMLLTHSYFTKKLDCVSKPQSVDVDGPQGLSYRELTTCVYPSQVVLAASFNTELARECGSAVGREALENGISGWYAPGLNLHRTAFGGRAFEYYSEDPVLSGKMGAACVSGAADMRLVAFIKHFAMTNYENYSTCMTLWATEQTMRELYLKSFEIVVKQAQKTVMCYSGGELVQKEMRGCTGVMAAAGMLGYDWCAANYPLLTQILRGEWGFCGTVTTDMALQTSVGIIDKALRAGSDLRMRSSDFSLLDESSPTALWVFRRAVKNVCFTYANSNLMQGLASGAVISYEPAPWQVCLAVFDVLVFAAVAAIAAYVAWPALSKRK